MTEYNDNLVDFGYIKSCLKITACTILSLGLLATWAASESTPVEHPRAAAQRAMSDKPHVVDAAFGACKALNKRRVLVGCEVEAKVPAIDVTQHVPPLEAAGFCRDIADTVARQTNLLAGSDWNLRIFSPEFVGTRLRAKCKLR